MKGHRACEALVSFSCVGFLGLASFLHVAPSLEKTAWAGRGVVLVPGKVPGFAFLRLSVSWQYLLFSYSRVPIHHPPIHPSTYPSSMHTCIHPPSCTHASNCLPNYPLTHCLLIFLPTLLRYPSANTSDFSSVHPSKYLYIHACLYTFMQAHIHSSLCIHSCIHVSVIHLFIYPSVYQSTSLIIKAT